MTLHPLNNNVIFKFLDDRTSFKGAFIESTISGIIIPRTETTQKVARWGEVVAVGPKCAGLEAGDFILIEGLMWMEGVKLDDEEMVWKTDDSKVLAVTNDREACQSQAL